MMRDMKNELLAFLMVALSLMGAVILAEENSEEKQVREFGQQQETQRQDRRQDQKEENQVFRESLEGKTSAEQSEAIESQRSARDQDNSAFDARMLNQSKDFDKQQEIEKQELWQTLEDARIPQQSMGALNNRFARESKLTAAEKNELINSFKSQYQKNIPYCDELYSGNVAFFEQTVNSQNLTQEQKKAAIKSHFEEQQSNMQ